MDHNDSKEIPDLQSEKKTKSVDNLDPKNSSKKSMGTDNNVDKKIWYFQLFRYSTLRDKIFIAIATIFSAICGGIQPYLMLAFGDVTGVIVEYAANLNDSLTQDERGILEDNLFDGINRFALNCSLCGLATIISTYVAGVLFSYSALRQIYHIRKLLLKKVLYQDMAWYDLNKTGEFASIFTENLSKVEEGIGEKLGTFIYFETIFVVGIVMALAMGWKLALVCMVSLPVSTILIGLISWLSTKFAQQELEAYGAAGAIAEEVLSSIRTVVAFNGQDKEFERYDEHLQFVKNNNIKKSMFTGMSNGLMWFFVYASYALSFWYGVGLILEERDLPENERVYTPANMVAVFFCTLIAAWHFGSGTPYFEIFGTACGAATKIFDILDSEPVINLSKDKGMQPKEINGEIALENVYFQYPSRTDVAVLQGINISIKSGETVALVGNSGCGKSTCIQLIQRFYDAASGRVLIDNYNIKDLNLTWLRNQISVVGQEPALFATTIAENIKFGNFKATQSEIEAAAKKANAHSFIRNLPHGYQTVIGERGAQLSGGQKQRIAIARALIKHPKILLLDEATSALDSTSEAEVQAALDAISGVCTTIIVAHRLSTIRNANRILVLSDGRVVEEGTHNELMQKGAVYYGLVKSQGLEDVKETEGGQLIKKIDNNVVEKANGVAFQNPVEEDVIELDAEEKTSGVVFEILKMNRPEWFFILMGCISSIITGASLPVYGVVFGDIIGVLADRDAGYVREQSNIFSLYFVIIGIVSAAAHFVMMYTFSVAGEKLTSRIRRKMFHCMLHEEMGWFDRKENGVGSLCAKLSSEAASVQGAAGIRIGTILNSLSTFLIANTIALYYNWKLALVLISFSPLILVSVFFEQKFTQSDAQKNQKYLENSAKIAVEAIGNIKTVASLNSENFFLNKYIQELKPYLVNSKKKGHFMAVTMGVARSIMFFAYVAAMVYGSILIVDTGIPYATVFIVSETVIVGSWSIGNAFSFSPNLQKGLSSAQRIFKLLSRTPKVRNSHNAKIYEKVKGNVDYENVYFSYPNRPNTQILNGLFLAVVQQKTIALCGPSGCGKSTVVQLLERFYDPTGGRVTLDTENIKEIDIYNLRSHMSIVSQEPNLFNATILENIAYGDNSRKVGMDEIIEAAKQANIHNFVVSLPQGYETNLGNKGTQLSGGQKQRIAIARALIRNPKILLLDEATSALDHENEKIVQESLDNAKKNRTCIIIAHRLTTVQDADLICVLNEGVIREMGTHSELLDMKGLYYNYYKLQTLPQ